MLIRVHLWDVRGAKAPLLTYSLPALGPAMNRIIISVRFVEDELLVMNNRELVFAFSNDLIVVLD
jgi:hypothetical protein